MLKIGVRKNVNDALLNLIKDKNSDNLISKIYLYAKNVSKPKYQFLI